MSIAPTEGLENPFHVFSQHNYFFKQSKSCLFVNLKKYLFLLISKLLLWNIFFLNVWYNTRKRKHHFRHFVPLVTSLSALKHVTDLSLTLETLTCLRAYWSFKERPKGPRWCWLFFKFMSLAPLVWEADSLLLHSLVTGLEVSRPEGYCFY